MPERVGIIAALEREVRPLVSKWKRAQCGELKGWRSGDLLVVCGGIGPVPAQRAAEIVVREFHPELLISVGFAGSLDPSVKPPDVLVPARVLDGRSGREYQTVDSGNQMSLLTLDGVASATSKAELSRCFGAQAVDMEAAAVAQVACSRGLQFRAVKAISEDVNFPIPSFVPFITEDGRLRLGSLLAHAAMRPGLWAALAGLGRNSARAARALSLALRPLERGDAALDGVAQPSRGVG